ncbi:MAG: mannose-1-phosphate guanylyltransferase/mannose-6-phosphate isomerase [Sterolibacteriaceae bacterium]|nr:mannose-1-phosphate guanylyltransferase/mannose-6-phosphate isomerase [Sterolibacteriaceae bacterium]MBK9084264.1 mannose-1-phosphate guanylyltransferase/mannose-6-phosphate isomerase [Sterolibacteriaceae bacterium]
MTTQILPVILSGGSGTRLWPLSREQYPKQLLPLFEQETLLQSTATRLTGFKGAPEVAAQPLVVCNEEYRFITAEQLRAAGKPASTLILEPMGRNTAPALTLAALASAEADPVLLVMPADHVVADKASFQRAIEDGAQLAVAGAVVTFGIVPDRPETGYGYIQAGESGQHGARRIARFVEKPDLATAERYLASGEYLWNSGLFMLRASAWLKAIGHFRPDILAACESAMEKGSRDADFLRVDKTAFAACPPGSIDYAVMEKLPGDSALGIAAHVVPMSCGWSDVGAWDALWQVAEKDGAGNATRGDVMLHETSGSLVMADGRMVACIGIEDMVVIETPDAVLVARKDRTQGVKHIVARLKTQSRSEAATHRKVYRPWGWYDSIDCGARFQVKRIVVKPGASLSMQMHHHRAEHWIVVTGTARVTRGDEVILVSENQSTYIPLGTKHQLENPGKVPLEMIEVQSGTYLGEDDIVRFHDTYGRG